LESLAHEEIITFRPETFTGGFEEIIFGIDGELEQQWLTQ
jgi:hypothetical protein